MKIYLTVICEISPVSLSFTVRISDKFNVVEKQIRRSYYPILLETFAHKATTKRLTIANHPWSVFFAAASPDTDMWAFGISWYQVLTWRLCIFLKLCASLSETVKGHIFLSCQKIEPANLFRSHVCKNAFDAASIKFWLVVHDLTWTANKLPVFKMKGSC